MSYLETKIILPSEIAEAFSDELMEAGALSSAIEDAYAGTDQEEPIFGEPGEPDPTLWTNSLVISLFSEDAQIDAILSSSAKALNLDLPDYKINEIEEQDWVRLTQSQFDPIHVTERMWIVPSWHDIPDNTAINLKLDPGLAFGTGSHPTTRLCLQWLDRELKKDQTVLDYGCGSGILAIAAKKFGALSVVGVDIDKQAIVSSKDNADINDVSARFYLPDEFMPDAPFDVVVANILANPLRLLGKMLAAYTKPGGRIVLSGLLVEQEAEINQLYSEWFDMDEVFQSEGWACLSGVKRPD